MLTHSARKILTREFVLVCLAQFTFISAFYILLPTLPIYLSRSGCLESEIGVLIGAFFVASLVLRPFVGRALLRIPEKKFMIGGSLLFSVTALAYLGAPPFWPFFLVRVIQGVGLAFYHTASFTLVANISPEDHRGESLSYFFLAPNVSLALIPSLGMFVLNQWGSDALFLVCLGTTLCSLLITTQLRMRRIVETDEPARDTSGFSWRAFPPSVVGCLNYVTWGALTAFFPLYALRHGVENSGLFFTVIAVMFFVSRLFGGRALDVYSRDKVMPVLLGTCVASTVVLAFSNGLGMFFVAAVMWGIGNGLLTPAMMAYAIDRAGPSNRGPAVGMYTLLSDLGLGLGPAVMGIVIRLTNYEFMFLCLAFTGLINFVYFHFFVRSKAAVKTL
jgi:MFS family permease